MNIIFFSSEVFPFSKTGGLADVSAGLPKALKKLGNDIRIFTPYYKSCEKFNPVLIQDSKIAIKIGGTDVEAEIYQTTLPDSDVPVYMIDNKNYFFRESLYSWNNVDYEDNFSRFVLFQRASIEYLKKINFIPDIVHSNDWPSALVSAYFKTIYSGFFPRVKTVFTIHNIGFQGFYWVWDMKLTGLPFELFNWRQLEYYGKINLMKGGIVFSDAVTTVSPTYSREILSAQYAYGLQSVLEEYKNKISGIINGVDYGEWSPETDKYIPYKYGIDTLENKYENKKMLLKQCGFSDNGAPLFGMISRLVEQKGIRFIIENIKQLMEKKMKIVILGTGDKFIESRLESIGKEHPDKFKVFINFNTELSHLIEAGSDIYLMPSLFEPCGLNQLYSMKYGTIPLARRTGGLADTIIDATPQNIKIGEATGFLFNNIDNLEFLNKINKAIELFNDKSLWNRIIKNAMSKKWSWDFSAGKYLELYDSLIKP
ncbi:MAG TPA: glycogen synthase GlgA [bacterium]|mgnify:CR=1 FL=1|nr:glycogen synthase GlgA [bacterium]HPN30723.1 glycogen synthase GlgA [bacterium]